MKSLLDIQQDVRKLEKSVQEISRDINAINADIDDLRNSSEVDVIDFNAIEILSKHIRFYTHPINRLKEGRQCQVYLEMLLNIVRLDRDREITVNRMIFIQWLQKKSLLDWSLEDLYRDIFKQSKDSYYSIVDEIPANYRDFFVLDLMIVGNIAGRANREIQEYIVDLATILGIDKENMSVIATVAKAVLCQEVEGFTREQIMIVLAHAKKFKYYLPSEIIDQAVIGLRVVDVELADSDIRKFKWTIKNLEYVEAGDIVATYMRERKKKGASYRDYVEDEITASESGVIFQFRNDKINYGVIGHETDNKDSIKEWIKEGRR